MGVFMTSANEMYGPIITLHANNLGPVPTCHNRLVKPDPVLALTQTWPDPGPDFTITTQAQSWLYDNDNRPTNTNANPTGRHTPTQAQSWLYNRPGPGDLPTWPT